jgi:hypothetical protein
MVGGPVETLQEGETAGFESCWRIAKLCYVPWNVHEKAQRPNMVEILHPRIFESLTHFRELFAVHIEFARSLCFSRQICPKLCSWIRK